MEYPEIIKLLTNVRSIRAMMRELSVDLAKEIQSKIETVVNEKVQEDEEQKQLLSERSAKVQELRELMAAEGISIDDLAASNTSAPKAQGAKRAPRPAKYQYTTAEGAAKTWTGQGRMPSEIAAAVSTGTPLDSFLIPTAE